jgi:putative chitinase
MTPAELRRILPLAGAAADVFAAPLTAAMERFEINTPARQAAFLAQVGHESAHLTQLSENLNYSESGLMKTWPARFPTSVIAEQYQRKPEKIANRVYANRMHNGDEASGDGWRYRGAGLIQLTGKENHLAAALYFDKPLEEIGDWLRTPEGASLSAAWFWKANGLNELADAGDQEAITRRINGGTLGLKDRIALFDRAQEVLA